jgi:hypothetical protein
MYIIRPSLPFGLGIAGDKRLLLSAPEGHKGLALKTLFLSEKGGATVRKSLSSAQLVLLADLYR